MGCDALLQGIFLTQIIFLALYKNSRQNNYSQHPFSTSSVTSSVLSALKKIIENCIWSSFIMQELSLQPTDFLVVVGRLSCFVASGILVS